jgi:CubicO group peptidase (beta-lactamase class C family)
MQDPDVGRRPERLLALERGVSPSDFPTALHKITLRSTPGSDEQYSNAAMKVIAMGLEHVYGEAFSALLNDEVFAPLHMRDTVFTLSDAQRRRLAVGYDRAGRPAPYHTPNAGASWGLYSSTADMARYVAWQLDEKNPVVAQAHTLIEGDAADGKGMIWNEGMERGERVLWHGGGSFGMSSQVVLYPDSGQGFVLLANDTCEGTEGALKDIASAVHTPDR